jgi:uncharacterized membrane protein required for colicin V production
MPMILEAVSVQTQNDWGLFLAQLQWLDILSVIVFVLGVFFGLKRGLSKTIPFFVEVVLAQAVAVEYYSFSAAFLSKWVPVPLWILQASTFALLSVCVIILVKFVGQIISLVATLEFKPMVSNIGGALLGGLHFILFLSLLSSFIVLIPVPFIQESWTSRSMSGPYLLEASKKANKIISPWLPKELPEKVSVKIDK